MPISTNRALRLLCLPPLFALCLSACDRGTTKTTPATAPTASAPAATATAAGSAPATAPAAAPAAFDPASVAESTASLPPFPFFKAPEGLKTVFDEKDRNINFDRAHIIAGDKVVAIEGRIVRDKFQLANPDQREYRAIEFQRNYENAIRNLGGARVSKTQYTSDVLQAFGGREAVDKHYLGTCASDGCENHT